MPRSPVINASSQQRVLSTTRNYDLLATMQDAHVPLQSRFARRTRFAILYRCITITSLYEQVIQLYTRAYLTHKLYTDRWKKIDRFKFRDFQLVNINISDTGVEKILLHFISWSYIDMMWMYYDGATRLLSNEPQ